MQEGISSLSFWEAGKPCKSQKLVYVWGSLVVKGEIQELERSKRGPRTDCFEKEQ